MKRQVISLDKVKFIKAMEYITLAYPNSKIEVDNKNMMNVWYDVLKDVSEVEFIPLLKNYVKENVYPPSSPAHLLDYAKQSMLSKSDAGLVFEKLISRIRENNYDLDITIKKYQNGNNTAVVKSIMELYSNFKLWFNDANQLPYLKRDFIGSYNRNINKLASERILSGDTTLLIGD